MLLEQRVQLENSLHVDRSAAKMQDQELRCFLFRHSRYRTGQRYHGEGMLLPERFAFFERQDGPAEMWPQIMCGILRSYCCKTG